MDTDYRKYSLTSNDRRKLLPFGYVIISMLCLLFYHNILLSLAAGLLVFFFSDTYAHCLAEKRRELLKVQFKDLLYSLSASIATGRHMSQSLGEALQNLKSIYSEDTPMIRELEYIVRAISENRDREEYLLADFARRSGIDDIRDFVDVYLACRVTGGELERVIADASEVLMDKMSIEREIRALTAQKRFECRLISIMPIAAVLFLNIFSPDYLEAMYTTVGGRLVMTAALAGIASSYKLTLKLTEINV